MALGMVRISNRPDIRSLPLYLAPSCIPCQISCQILYLISGRIQNWYPTDKKRQIQSHFLIRQKQGQTVHMLQLFVIYIPLAHLYMYTYIHIYKYIYIYHSVERERERERWRERGEGGQGVDGGSSPNGLSGCNFRSWRLVGEP